MSDVTRRFSFVALCVASLCLAATPASAQVPQRGLPSRNLLDRFGLERAWSNQATIDSRSDVVLHLIADEQVVIVQTRTGVLTVFDAESGVKLWDGLLAQPNQFSYPAVTNAESLFIVIGSTVYTRDKYTGNELWTLRLPGPPSTSPLVTKDRMYVGTLGGSVYSYDLASVAAAQAQGLLPQYAGTTLVWRYGTSNEIVTAPVTNGKIVAFANRAGSLYAVTPTDRSSVYQFETDAPSSAPLELVDDALLYAVGDNNFYCLNAPTGTTRWLHVAGAPIRTKPRLIDKSVFLTPIDAGLYNLSVENGEEIWSVPIVTQFIAATPTRIFGSDRGGNIAVLDRNDGAVLGTLPLVDFSIRFANERTDRMFLATTTGLVTCLRERGAEIPIYHRYPERRPILPLFGEETPAAPAEEAVVEEPPADPTSPVE
ncbi:MAG: PQQ-binding-like beta-propeller repeat protein [Planctomycetaceae bacterium]